MLCHINLYYYYKIIFSMVQHHKYSIEDIENMYPYERDVFYEMILDYLTELEKKQAAMQQRG